MRGTIFKHKDSNHHPVLVQVGTGKTDGEILEIERGLLKQGYEPVPTAKEFFSQAVVNFWLIWSFEHDAWWKPRSQGYTKKIKEAGRYSFDQACEIVTKANKYVKEPNEAMLPEVNQ